MPVSPVLAQMSYQFADIRELIIARGQSGGLSIATLLSVLTDSAANLFQPGVKEPADRFKKFVFDNFPWADDKPFGLEPRDAVDLMWEIVRTPAVHRLGLQPERRLHTLFRHVVAPIFSLLDKKHLFSHVPFLVFQIL